MEIVDKYGYLEDVLKYIEKNIINSRGLFKISQKANIEQALLQNLSRSLKGFSENQFFTALEEKLEERHSSPLDASAELAGADMGIELDKNKAFIMIKFKWDIAVEGEREDRTSMQVQIFSKNNIKVRVN